MAHRAKVVRMRGNSDEAVSILEGIVAETQSAKRQLEKPPAPHLLYQLQAVRDVNDPRMLSIVEFAYEGYGSAITPEFCKQILAPHLEGELEIREGFGITAEPRDGWTGSTSSTKIEDLRKPDGRLAEFIDLPFQNTQTPKFYDRNREREP